MIQDALLWYDDDPRRELADKVKRAVERYMQKYGHAPDVCYVLDEPEIRKLLDGGCAKFAEDVRVLPAKSVLRWHFWLGVQEAGGNHSGLGKKRIDGQAARVAADKATRRSTGG
jgi:hypothetical protein